MFCFGDTPVRDMAMTISNLANHSKFLMHQTFLNESTTRILKFEFCISGMQQVIEQYELWIWLLHAPCLIPDSVVLSIQYVIRFRTPDSSMLHWCIGVPKNARPSDAPTQRWGCFRVWRKFVCSFLSFRCCCHLFQFQHYSAAPMWNPAVQI